MLQRYRNDVVAAWTLRRQRPVPAWTGVACSGLGLLAVYIGVAILWVPKGGVPHFHFVDEDGAITALSAILLSVAAGFALVALLAVPDAGTRDRLFWLTLAAGLTFLALDELLEFHERLGTVMDRSNPTGGIGGLSKFRNWNDLAVILYGVVAMFPAALFLPSVLRYPRMAELLGVAVACYVTHTAIDSLVEPQTVASVIVEESCKVLCGYFLGLASLVGLLGELRRLRTTT